MKKTLSIFSVLTLVSSVVLAGGIDDPKKTSDMAVMKKMNNQVSVFYKSNKESNVVISIYDTNNKLRFSEVIRKSDGFSRPYDLSNLPFGDYKIEMKDGNKTWMEEVTTGVAESSLLPHIIKLKGPEERLLLTVADKNATMLTIQLQNSNRETVLELKEPIDKQFSRLFYFAEVCESCTFIISTDTGAMKTLAY